MTSSKSPIANLRRVAAFRYAALAPVLAASLVLMLLPPSVTAPLKGAASSVLAPGERWANVRRQRTGRWIAQWRAHLATAEEQQTLTLELERLRARNVELETALELARQRPPGEESLQLPSPSAPLVRTELIQARVLGPQVRSFLQRLEVIDAGSAAGLEAGLPVFAESTAMLDQGRNAGLAVDDLALAGRRIVGKLTSVGPQTSVMRRVTDAGYRELVQLAERSGDDERLRLGARGVLEGVGEALCRIRMVEITEPVSVGDLVLATGEISAGAFGAVYGRVSRAERRPGDAHWQLWMEPAVGQERLTEVAVLRLQLNAERVARASDEERSK